MAAQTGKNNNGRQTGTNSRFNSFIESLHKASNVLKTCKNIEGQEISSSLNAIRNAMEKYIPRNNQSKSLQLSFNHVSRTQKLNEAIELIQKCKGNNNLISSLKNLKNKLNTKEFAFYKNIGLVINTKAVNNGKNNGGNKPTTQPRANNGGNKPTTQPRANNGGNKSTTQPRANNGGNKRKTLANHRNKTTITPNVQLLINAAEESRKRGKEIFQQKTGGMPVKYSNEKKSTNNGPKKVKASYTSDNIKIETEHYIGMKSNSISLITFEKQKNRVNNERLGCELKIFLQHLIDENSITNNHELLIKVSKNDKTKNTLFNTMGFKRGPISIHSPTYFFTQTVGNFMKNRQCGNNIVKNVKNNITITESPLILPSKSKESITNTTNNNMQQRKNLKNKIDEVIPLLKKCNNKNITTLNRWKIEISKTNSIKRNPVSQYRLILMDMIAEAIKSGSCTVNNKNALTTVRTKIRNQK